MVELENFHDAAQEFEPIHRIVLGLSGSLKNALADEFGGTVSFEPFANREAFFAAVDATKDGLHVQIFGLSGHYQYSARETIQAIRAYAQSEPITLKSESGVAL